MLGSESLVLVVFYNCCRKWKGKVVPHTEHPLIRVLC